MEAVAPSPITIAPSSFAFLYDECKACFYDHCHDIMKRPRGGFPTIFTNIDSAMKKSFMNGEWHKIDGLDQKFIVESAGKRVTSVPITFEDKPDYRPVILRGNYDAIILLEDGRRFVIDFKTSPIKPDLIPKYSRQLHTYPFGLENPAKGDPLKIDGLGLAVYEPSAFGMTEGTGLLSGRFVFVPIERDDQKFELFLREMTGIISMEQSPEPDLKCEWCRFRQQVIDLHMERLALEQGEREQDGLEKQLQQSLEQRGVEFTLQ